MIYIITHKSFKQYFSDPDHYRILHVGQNQNTESDYLNDFSGDSISEKNGSFCELTGLYWIWKNDSSSEQTITGLLHYRRYFTTRLNDLFYTYLDIKPKVLPYKQIKLVLNKADIILPVPEKIFSTVFQSYSKFHFKEDLILTRQAISEICPNYLSAFDNVMSSHKHYYANMMICNKKNLNSYSKWLFSVLNALEKKIDLNKYKDNYQKRVFGFISERLLQVWVVHNNLKIIEFPVFNTESKRMTIYSKTKNRFVNLFKFLLRHLVSRINMAK